MTGTARVGYVVEAYPRLSETFVVTEMRAREAHGEQLAIFVLRPPEEERVHPEVGRVRAPVTYLPLPSAGEDVDLFQAEHLARAARAAGITHMHAHFAVAATTVTRLASLATGIPYSFTAHAVDIFAASVDIDDLQRKFSDAAFAVTVSDFNLAYLRERVPSAASKTSRIYNGVDLERFPFVERVPHGGDTRVLAVGRLVEKKGFGLLIEAVRRLRDRGRAVRLDVVGGGELEAQLRAQVAASGQAGAIHLLGAEDQDAVAARMRDADLFVAPSLVAADGNADALPTVLLEAMASGVPCVSTALTGIPEIVRPGETGLLCSPGDVDALTETLETALAPGFDGRALARRGRAHIEREFDAVRQAAVLGELTRRGSFGAGGPVFDDRIG